MFGQIATKYNSQDTIEYNLPSIFINELQQKHKANLINSTAENKENATSIAVIRTLRINVEKRRKELKKEALDYGKSVDLEARRLTHLLNDIEEPLKKEKEAYAAKKAAIAEEKQCIENKRIKAIKDTIENIRLSPRQFNSATVSQIIKAIEYILFSEDKFDYQEFAAEALQVKTKVIAELKQLQKEREEHYRQKKEAEEKQIALAKLEDQLKAERKKLEEERVEAQQKADDERVETARLAKIEQDKLIKERQELADREATLKQLRIQTEKKQEEESKEHSILDAEQAYIKSDAKVEKQELLKQLNDNASSTKVISFQKKTGSSVDEIILQQEISTVFMNGKCIGYYTETNNLLGFYQESASYLSLTQEIFKPKWMHCFNEEQEVFDYLKELDNGNH